jgi:hypothetical protein
MAHGRAPALQAQDPEFRPQHCQKRKERKNITILSTSKHKIWQSGLQNTTQLFTA